MGGSFPKLAQLAVNKIAWVVPDIDYLAVVDTRGLETDVR